VYDVFFFFPASEHHIGVIRRKDEIDAKTAHNERVLKGHVEDILLAP
jgi:hypothetical protein